MHVPLNDRAKPPLIVRVPTIDDRDEPLRLGVAHGSMRDFGTQGETKNEIVRDTVRSTLEAEVGSIMGGPAY